MNFFFLLLRAGLVWVCFRSLGGNKWYRVLHWVMRWTGFKGGGGGEETRKDCTVVILLKIQ